jgi:menaquinone-dependent protoporphyrinogen IX oxidase
MVMQLKGIRVELALLDELINIDMDAYDKALIGPSIAKSRQGLQDSIKSANTGLAKAKKGLESAKELGDQKTIDTFGRWIKVFEGKINLANKNIKVLNQLDIV